MKFLLLFVLFLLIFRFLSRVLFGSFVRTQQRPPQQPKSDSRKEGEVSVEFLKDKSSIKKSAAEGDFVDYDEVD